MRLLVCLVLVVWPALAAGGELRAEAKARVQNIEQHLDDWDLETARRELRELEKLVPGDIEPLLYLKGRLAFEEGRYPDAVELLTRAGVGDDPRSYLRLARETLAVTKDHAKVESAHFIFLYPKGKDEVLAPYALETLEAIRTALLEDLGHAPEGKVRVEVVNDARELARVSTLKYEQIKKTGTIAICKFSKLMVTSPKAVLRGYDWQDTLAHEYVHLVVSQLSKNTVPIWLHEGLAKYLESRWRGSPGQAMTPSTLALLGSRVRKNKLIPFEKMHPSIALLPSAADAATAFAEVYFAIDLLHREYGTAALRNIIAELRSGQSDKKAIEAATGKGFPAFERAWLAHVQKQQFPKELVALYAEEDKAPEIPQLAENGKAEKPEKKDREISFGDFVEVQEPEARKLAHLGELLRERNRVRAAAEQYAKAHRIVGDRYESISNKYALTLLDLGHYDNAETVLRGSLRLHPGAPSTNVHLGRLYLFRKELQKAKAAYRDALSSDPFNPEIHLGLMHAHQALGESALLQRAQKAAALLTRRPPEEVTELARLVAQPPAVPPADDAPRRPQANPRNPDAGTL